MGISEQLVSNDSECQIDELTLRFQQQRSAYLVHPEVDYRDRIRHLKLLRKMLIKHRKEIRFAINTDYVNRSDVETMFGEIAVVILSINHMIHNLKSWMKPQKRKVGLAFVGGKSEVVPQALGVVGIIVPWNFPVYLSFIPIATALAAGNRVMVKMSDRSSSLAKFLDQTSSQYFPEDTLSFVEETGRVGERFSLLPFDLLLFTGSSSTGKAVMKSAANNLTPVILELGGKNPVIIDPSFPLEKAVERIIFAKQTNAGQVCLNVDNVFVKEQDLGRFVAFAKANVKKMIPDISSAAYSSVIDEESMGRLAEALEDAKRKGAMVINLSEQDIDYDNRKFPITLVVNPTDEMEVLQRENFGPIFSVITYDKSQEVIDAINASERPLALYIFSYNKARTKQYITNIMSGGVTVNEVAMHVAQNDLPFGGVGNSGMGHYHGPEGFESFSKMRPVFYQPKFGVFSLLNPPLPGWFQKLINL